MSLLALSDYFNTYVMGLRSLFTLTVREVRLFSSIRLIAAIFNFESQLRVGIQDTFSVVSENGLQLNLICFLEPKMGLDSNFGARLEDQRTRIVSWNRPQILATKVDPRAVRVKLSPVTTCSSRKHETSTQCWINVGPTSQASNTIRWPNVELILARRPRCWPSSKLTLSEGLVLYGGIFITLYE